MERNVKHLLQKKADVLKTSIFRKESLKKCTYFEEQKGKRYIKGIIYIDIIVFSCLWSRKSCLRFFFLFVLFGR